MTKVLLIGGIVIVCIVLYAISAYLQDSKPIIICLVIGVLTLSASLLSDLITSIIQDRDNDHSTSSSISRNIDIVSITPSQVFSATPTSVPTATPTLVPPVTSSAYGSDDMVTLIGGIQAPASDFLFPESRNEILTKERMDQVLKEGAANKIEMNLRSQMAINEILARYGFIFQRQDTKSSEQAREKFSGKEWYQELQGKYPSDINTLKDNYFTEEEQANYKALNDWQVTNEVSFYVGLDGIPFTD